MPKIGKTKRKRRVDEAAELRMANWEEFSAASAWRRASRGNLWREWEGETITVFERPAGSFNWSVADEDGPRYSREVFDDEDDAMMALCEEVGAL